LKTPCHFCGHPFDQELLGRYGCCNCHGEGLDEKPNKKEQTKMKIDKRGEEVVYITINGKTVYIDDSTGELIIQAWDEQTDEPIKPAMSEIFK